MSKEIKNTAISFVFQIMHTISYSFSSHCLSPLGQIYCDVIAVPYKAKHQLEQG